MLLGICSSSRIESELSTRLWSTFTLGSDLGTEPVAMMMFLRLERLLAAALAA